MDSPKQVEPVRPAEYSEWIKSNVHDPKHKCREVTEEMQRAFPELRRVAGHYYSIDGIHPHWWLTAPDGSIVDPTIAQFADQHGEYVEHDGDLPIGRCANCGEYIYPGQDTVCSESCYHEYVAFCMKGSY